MFSSDEEYNHSAPQCGYQSYGCQGDAAPDENEGGHLEINDKYVCLNCYARVHANKEDRD